MSSSNTNYMYLILGICKCTMPRVASCARLLLTSSHAPRVARSGLLMHMGCGLGPPDAHVAIIFASKPVAKTKADRYMCIHIYYLASLRSATSLLNCLVTTNKQLCMYAIWFYAQGWAYTQRWRASGHMSERSPGPYY